MTEQLAIGGYHLSLREFDAAAHLPRHEHADAFVTIVVEGQLREESSSGAREAHAHEVIIHAPGEAHANRFAGPRTRCLRVQGVAFERTALLSAHHASPIAAKVQAEFRAPDALSAMVLEAAMLELFVIGERQRAETRLPSWLARAHATLEERFGEPLTLADLAQFVDVHPGHLARAFRLHYGVTVGERIRALRVEYARQRLASAAPLHEIARDAGFADQSHFTRTFRRETGLTPARYRRALRSF